MKIAKVCAALAMAAVLVSAGQAKASFGAGDTKCSSVKQSSFTARDPIGQYLLGYVAGGVEVFIANFDPDGEVERNLLRWNDQRIFELAVDYCRAFPERPLREAGTGIVSAIITGDE